MERVIVFTESIMPSTCHFIPAQVDQLHRFAPTYAGLVPAQKNLELQQTPILLRSDRSHGLQDGAGALPLDRDRDKVSCTFETSGSEIDPCALC